MLKEAIKPGQTKLLVVNFPHNPTGAILTLAQQQEIVEMAKFVFSEFSFRPNNSYYNYIGNITSGYSLTRFTEVLRVYIWITRDKPKMTAFPSAICTRRPSRWGPCPRCTVCPECEWVGWLAGTARCWPASPSPSTTCPSATPPPARYSVCELIMSYVRFDCVTIFSY